MRKNNGFTLIELLVAIVVVALIGLASSQILNAVFDTNDHSQAHFEQLEQLQRAMLVIEQDFQQITPRTARIDGQETPKRYLVVGDNQFDSEDGAVGFVRLGWYNPGLRLPRSTAQAVAYRLMDGKLERLHTPFVDQVAGTDPMIRVLLEEIESLKFEFFGSDGWQEEWDQAGLPRAIAIILTSERYGELRRQFLVPNEPQKVNS